MWAVEDDPVEDVEDEGVDPEDGHARMLLLPGRTSERRGCERASVAAILAATTSPASPSSSSWQGRHHRRPCVRVAGASAIMSVLVVIAAKIAIRTPSFESRARAAQLFEEPPACQRCPVGDCDRNDETGECKWYPPPIDGGGAYHCQVEHCDLVPTGVESLSGCWHYHELNFYSVVDISFPCRKKEGEAEQSTAEEPTTSSKHAAAATDDDDDDSAATDEGDTSLGEDAAAHSSGGSSDDDAHSGDEKDHATAAPTPAPVPSGTGSSGGDSSGKEDDDKDDPMLAAAAKPLGEKPASEAHEKKDHEKKDHEKKDHEKDHEKETTAPPSTSTARHSDDSSKASAEEVTPSPMESIFRLGASDISSESKHRDPRLSAYWDIGDCGPMGDDFNVHWCGGLVYEPDCQKVVPVNTSLCMSGNAALSSVSGDKDSAWTQFNDCSYEYFAQYECLPETSTSTSSTTSTQTTTRTTTRTHTSTRTSTTSRTSSTTTTSTVLTTTLAQEGAMLDTMDVMEMHLAAPDDGWKAESGLDDPSCLSTFRTPKPPVLATDLNGIRLPDVCIRSKGPHYVQVIGDWGGVLGPHGPKPANQRSKEEFVHGVDDKAQQRVAGQMRERARHRSPDYLLNVGDNFYWSGLNVACGTPAYQVVPTGQFEWNFEKIYTGDGLEGKPWLGVLGNHDYGGYMFNKGWDQLIAYTWGTGGRWVMPAQYWAQKVHYPGFSVDYFFVDSNVYNAAAAEADPEHNICSNQHVPKDAGCGKEGPASVQDCPVWFSKLWAEQQVWLDKNLDASKADWQIVVTHFPPTWGVEYWKPLALKHGIDLIVTGHMHNQALHHLGAENFLKPTAWIVSGGGGGITSDAIPDLQGNDDQYGFFELTLTKEVIEIQGISHGGFVRSTTFLRPRKPGEDVKDEEHKTELDAKEFVEHHDAANPEDASADDAKDS